MASNHDAAGRGETKLYGLPLPASSPPTHADVVRLEGTVVELRQEIAGWITQQKRGNVISLRVQGDLSSFERTLMAGFKKLQDQNTQILKLLKAKR